MSERTAATMFLASRTFAAGDQSFFAALSGDGNPIHVDGVAARRSLAGEVIVHGMHTLCWALDALAKSTHRPGSVKAIDAHFLKPIYLGEPVDLALAMRTEDDLQLRVTSGTKLAVTIKLGIAAAGTVAGTYATPQSEQFEPGGSPRDLTLEACASASGQIQFAKPRQAFSDAFPMAGQIVDASALRGLAACSRLVGMECPGLRSVFSRLTIAIAPEANDRPLSFEVTEANARFRIVRMTVQGARLVGRIEAFAPAEPPRQLTPAEIRGLVPFDKYSAVTALIVGGSRGLGELTAKLLAAGGAQVTITYASGKADAERVVDDLAEFGGSHRVLRYDVKNQSHDQIPVELAARTTQVYYFATPSIFRHKNALFDLALLAEFNRFYCEGFYGLCAALNAAAAKPNVFYPSSVSIVERPKNLTEYAMSKAAGEILAADIPRLFPGLRVHISRLPRLLTDQTATLVPTATPPAESILLPILDEMTKAD